MTEENVQPDAEETPVPDEERTETPEQQAQREEAEGKLEDGEGKPDSEKAEEDAAAKRSQRVQKRIDQLTKQRHEALREAETLREENRKLKESQAVEPPADDPRPNFDDYDSVQKFEQDYDRWARRQAQRETQAQPQTVPVEEQEAIDRIQNAAIEASDRYPDFEQVVYDPSLPLTQEMIRAASETESVADVLYHLGKNREEAQRLSQLNGTSLVREMGRIEARLEAQKEQKGSGEQPAEGASGAPEPISTVGGSRAKRDPKPDEMSTEQWMRWRQEQINRKQRR